MSGEPLYNSRIFNIYLKLVRQKYDHIKPSDLLKQTNIDPREVVDRDHWFTQQQFDRFYENLIRETGDLHIAREAGRFAADPETNGFIRQYTLGFATPASAFTNLKRIMANLSHSCTFEYRQPSSHQMEISVHPLPGIKENAGQCDFRKGMLEAIVTIFGLDMPHIDHPDCLDREDALCRYLVSWKPSACQTFQKIRKLSGLAALTVPFAIWFFDPQMAYRVAMPIAVGIFFGTSMLTEHLQKSRLSKSLFHLRNSSEEMVDQISRNYNNALLTNEISHAISSKTTIEEILQSVSQTFEKRLDFDRGLILLTDADKTQLNFRVGFGLSPQVKLLLKNASFPLGISSTEDIFTIAFREMRSFLISDIAAPQAHLSDSSLNFLRKTGCRATICCPILCDGKALGVLTADQTRTHRPLNQNDLNLLSGLASVIGVSIRNAQLLASRKRQFNSTLQVLAATIDARDPLTAGHSEKVTEYSLGICRELGLSEDYCEMVRVAALLHDYGKIAVPDAILKKAGRLTVEEYEVVKTHAQRTHSILKQINFEGIYKRVPMVAGAHHEKIDGSGYPKGLTDDEIPIGAKIIAVADFFEAITAQRHYRDPMPLNIAYKVLKQEAFSHFDGKIVRAFLSYFKKTYPEDYERMLREAPTVNREIMRILCQTPVVFENRGQSIFGTSADISSGGIFVASNAVISEGSPVRLSFCLPDNSGNLIETGGRVAWVNHSSLPRKRAFPAGFGVEFTGLHRQACDAVHHFIRCFPERILA
jgi:HD-GYP domain-containing protein (c-di-GMP phosphodiesterase class II)/Tfp pilus assembly protein PilZ